MLKIIFHIFIKKFLVSRSHALPPNYLIYQYGPAPAAFKSDNLQLPSAYSAYSASLGGSNVGVGQNGVSLPGGGVPLGPALVNPAFGVVPS